MLALASLYVLASLYIDLVFFLFFLLSRAGLAAARMVTLLFECVKRYPVVVCVGCFANTT